jgi:hypothetical protein
MFLLLSEFIFKPFCSFGIDIVLFCFLASFEIELDPLDFNMVSEPPLRCWVDSLLLSTCLMFMPHVRGPY